MAKLKIGDPAPPFTLLDTKGRQVSLADFKNRTVVLYFYPKDNTPGCTKEACSFRDHYAAFSRKKTVVFGISPDDERSHQKFTDKFELPFPLLCDTDHKVASAYGAWGKKALYGRTFMGILRSTFVIGPDGKIQHIFDKVKVDRHAEDVLEALS